MVSKVKSHKMAKWCVSFKIIYIVLLQNYILDYLKTIRVEQLVGTMTLLLITYVKYFFMNLNENAFGATK